MPSIEVRPFRRADRQQLTDLVNMHASAVVPGLSVSVAAVLSQLERQPGEYIVDPWVSERLTLVAEQHERVAAAAHLLRYGAGEHVGPGTGTPARSAGCCSGRRAPGSVRPTGPMPPRRQSGSWPAASASSSNGG